MISLAAPVCLKTVPATRNRSGKPIAIDREEFLARFSSYRHSAYAHRQIDFMKDFATVMPWSVYAGMTDDDLSAIYEYLMSREPVKHKVVKFVPRNK